MRIAIILTFTIHGLIHLLGFVKAYGYAEVKQITHVISKPVGLVWLTVCVLFLLSAIMLAMKLNNWWWLAFAGIILSQLLIFSAWQDAKFGSIANLIILAYAIVSLFAFNYYRNFKQDTIENLSQPAYFTNALLSENDMAALPEPVKKYLRYTGCVGKPKVNNFKIKFVGKIRKNENEGWMEFNSTQYNFMHTPTRLFFMDAVMKGLSVAGYHCYLNGVAFMDIRLLSIFKVQFMNGEEMNTAETVTFFNDMCCLAPATLIDKRITWELINNQQVNAKFTNNGISISAQLFFNDKGELINFISNDRYDYDAKKRLPWSTPLKNYRSINGYNLAQNADAVYAYDRGEVCYGTFEMTEMEYNCREFTR